MNAELAEWLLTAYLKTQTRKFLTLEPSPGVLLPGPRVGNSYTLYVHVPFCESLCPYCSFNRFLFDAGKATRYFESLRQEMRMVAALGYTFKAMYIGGGTPTIVIEELIKTIDLAKELFCIQEVSCETNPNHLTPEMIEQLQGRVQRLSVGIQSFDDGLLQEMSRLEKFGTGDHLLESVQRAAPFFDVLNVDLIFNFPSQTSDMVKNDLKKVIQSGAQQATFYPLMSSKWVKKTNPVREWNYFNLINDGLQDDFKLLSAWTFGRKTVGMVDEYISDAEEYVGIGSGSFSYLDGTLYVNTFSLSEYDMAIRDGKSGVKASQHYKRHPQMRYWFMMKLFGLDFSPAAFSKRFGVSVYRGLWLEMLFLKIVGAFQRNGSPSLTRIGQYLSVVMMREFFTGVNNVRDIARKSLPSPLQPS